MSLAANTIARQLGIAVVLGLGAALALWQASRVIQARAVAPASSLASYEGGDNVNGEEAQGDRVIPDKIFDNGVAWINTADRIRLSDLRGKIVLLDFWTFCCINCHHVIPDLEYLEKKYANQLVVIGVHTPKFDAEKLTENVRKKVDEYRIKHPVVNDADQAIWQAFGVTSWPTMVLINAKGEYVGSAPGEGNRETLDRVIGKLIAEHRAKGELNEVPIVFRSESEKPRNTPLNFPGKVLADAKGNRLFISDTGYNRIVVTDLSGKFLYSIGGGEALLKDGSFEEAGFNRQQGMCLVDETLYVADVENHAIRAVDLKAKTVTTIAGNGEQSQNRSGGGAPKAFGLNSPWDLVQVSGRNVFIIAMAGPHQLWKLDVDNKRVTVWSGSGRENIVDGPAQKANYAQPSGLATDGQSVFVADSEVSGVRQVDLKTGAASTLIGHGLFDFDDKDGAFATARLQHCLGVAYADGKVYVADSYNNKVKVANLETKTIETLAGSRTAGYADGDGLKAAKFYQPGGLSLAGDTLYVADSNNSLIRTINLKTKDVKTLALQGVNPPSVKRKPPRFLLAQNVKAAAMTLKPAKTIKVNVEVQPPANFEVNKDAPIEYLVQTPDNPQATQADPFGSIVAPATQFVVDIPLAQEPKAGDKLNVKLSVATFVCRKGSQGVCMPKSYIVTIPIVFDAKGEDAANLVLDGGRK